MSEPKRYILVEISGEQWMHEKENKMTPAQPGEFVRWEDYDRLKAEVERLKAEPERLMFLLNNAYLANERLRKAGDALANEYIMDEVKKSRKLILGSWVNTPAIEAWNAAKEGKQS